MPDQPTSRRGPSRRTVLQTVGGVVAGLAASPLLPEGSAASTSAAATASNLPVGVDPANTRRAAFVSDVCAAVAKAGRSLEGSDPRTAQLRDDAARHGKFAKDLRRDLPSADPSQAHAEEQLTIRMLQEAAEQVAGTPTEERGDAYIVLADYARSLVTEMFQAAVHLRAIGDATTREVLAQAMTHYALRPLPDLVTPAAHITTVPVSDYLVAPACAPAVPAGRTDATPVVSGR